MEGLAYNRKDEQPRESAMRVSPNEIAAILGLTGVTTHLDLAILCEGGLPVSGFQALAEVIAPNKPDALGSIVSDSTRRIRKNQDCSPLKKVIG